MYFIASIRQLSLAGLAVLPGRNQIPWCQFFAGRGQCVESNLCINMVKHLGNQVDCFHKLFVSSRILTNPWWLKWFKRVHNSTEEKFHFLCIWKSILKIKKNCLLMQEYFKIIWLHSIHLSTTTTILIFK